MLAVIWFAGMNFADHRGKAYLYMHVTSLIRLPRCSMLNTHSVDTYLENTYLENTYLENTYRRIPTGEYLHGGFSTARSYTHISELESLPKKKNLI